MRAFLGIVALATAAGWVAVRPIQETTTPIQRSTNPTNPSNAGPAPFPELSGDEGRAAFRADPLFLDARQRSAHRDR